MENRLTTGGFLMGRTKLGIFILSLSIISIQGANAADVVVSSPAAGTVESPFNLQAQSATCDSTTTGSMAYSIDDGDTVGSVDGQSLNTSISASVGSHTLHVKSWATNGAGCDTDVAITVKSASSSQKSPWPVSVPEGAAPYSDLEQDSGWSADADSTISPNPPSIYTNTQSGSPVEMTLTTKGQSGKYTGWMAKKTIGLKAGQVHMLVRASYTFNSVSGIQAWEMGRRLTNENGVTDNGQTQLYPKDGQLEFDIVPSPKGGWKDTGCRFPLFVEGTTYNEEIYYVDDSDGALSVMYVSLNGTVCSIPSSIQNISGLAQGWSKNSAVMAFQPDANESAVEYKAAVKMSAWMW
jgi:hypothetical protein